MGRSAACSPARQGWHDERVLMSPHQLSRYSNDDERGSPGGEETTHLYDSDKAVVPVGPVGEVRLWHVRSCGADPTLPHYHDLRSREWTAAADSACYAHNYSCRQLGAAAYHRLNGVCLCVADEVGRLAVDGVGSLAVSRALDWREEYALSVARARTRAPDVAVQYCACARCLQHPAGAWSDGRVERRALGLSEASPRQ